MGHGAFDGLSGLATAKVMARMNRDAEVEAADVLAPSPGDRVLAIGIGPGVGVAHLAATYPTVQVAGVDPSGVMLAEARKRNRPAIETGRVELVQTAADHLPWPDGAFDGVLAVNSIQLWHPFEPSLEEVGRVLGPGGRLVALTHEWALNRSTGREPDAWFAWVSDVAGRCGFAFPRMWRARAEGGRSVAFEATRQPGQVRRDGGSLRGRDSNSQPSG